MFKQTYGFDTDILKHGVPVVVEDSETGRRNSHMIVFDREDDLDYFSKNKSGTYLINESSSTMLRLIDINGEIIKLPIKHFIGDKPRMTVKIYG